ncbi:MAG: hypothetical protein FWB91_10440 [Defluviitaleaceae bacterium]|nr:hypothetical protein [Defluviitaleaceae bacterium]
MMVLWVILQIIMWIFIVIFGLILLILLLCVVPIRYKINGETDGEIYARVSYLFGLVSFVYEFREGEGKSTLRIAGIRLSRRTKEKAAEAVTDSAKKATVETEDSIIEAKLDDSESHESPKKPEKKSGGFMKMIKTVKAVLTYPQGKTIIKLVFEAIRRTGRVIWPKYLRVSGKVGFADPSATGMFVGAYEALAGAFRMRHAVCISGDFTAESTVVSLSIAAKGSVSIARISIPFIRLLFRKPIRTLIKDIWRKEDSDE